MAETGPIIINNANQSSATLPSGTMSVDEIRVAARQRFKERVERGGESGCECHDSFGPEGSVQEGIGSRCVTGVRFVDSGQVFYFDACGLDVQSGDWVLVESSRGEEAARVVIAPHHVLENQLQGKLNPILRLLDDDDLSTFEHYRKESANAIRRFSATVRARGLQMKPVSAQYNFDGTQVTFHFSAPERMESEGLTRELSAEMNCRVVLHQVGSRDEARLLGGVGKCGRTLCCSTWLPMFPEVNMGMAKTQDLSLNPSKVSGVCGRLLCCLSYENDQYRKMKAVMPKLGQSIETPRGPGSVIAMQILRDLVTVRLANEDADVEFKAEDLGFGSPPTAKAQIIRKAEPVAPAPVAIAVEAPIVVEAQTVEEAADDGDSTSKSSKRRRRRRSRNRPNP
jgi:cell fate regulator YaaT (PSP1 superfamily)